MALPPIPTYSKSRSGYLNATEMLEQIATDLNAYGAKIIKAKKWVDKDDVNKLHYQLVVQQHTLVEEPILDGEGNPVLDVDLNPTYNILETEPYLLILKGVGKVYTDQVDGGGGEIFAYVTTPDQVVIDDAFDETTQEVDDFIKISLDVDFEDNISGSTLTGAKPWFSWDFGDSSELLTTNPRSIPVSYLITRTARGIFLYINRPGSDDIGSKFCWLLVQRPVDKDGLILDIGKAPVFCVFNTQGMTKKFVVREIDTFTPSPVSDATKNTEDSSKLINDKEMVATTEYGKYMVFFPNNINTARFMYKAELDMIGYTSADVISENLNVDLEIFGGRKKYKSLMANGPNNTKMRLLCLVAEQWPDGVDGEGQTIWVENKPPATMKESNKTFKNVDLELFDEPAIDDDIFTSANPTGG